MQFPTAVRTKIHLACPEGKRGVEQEEPPNGRDGIPRLLLPLAAHLTGCCVSRCPGLRKR